MPNEEMLRIEREERRLILSCCGGVAAQHCTEGSGQILLQSLTEGRADVVTEGGMCLNLGDLGKLGDAVHAMTIRLVAGKTTEEQILRYAREVRVLERRNDEMTRKGLDALEEHDRKEEATDGAGT